MVPAAGDDDDDDGVFFDNFVLLFDERDAFLMELSGTTAEAWSATAVVDVDVAVEANICSNPRNALPFTLSFKYSNTIESFKAVIGMLT